MKTTFLKKGLIVGLLLISSLAHAEEDKSSANSTHLDVKLTALENQRVYMRFQKLQNERVNISIYDKYGVELHSEKVTDKTQVMKKFDLSNLPAGKYSFEVSNDIYLMKRTLELK